MVLVPKALKPMPCALSQKPSTLSPEPALSRPVKQEFGASADRPGEGG